MAREISVRLAAFHFAVEEAIKSFGNHPAVESLNEVRYRKSGTYFTGGPY